MAEPFGLFEDEPSVLFAASAMMFQGDLRPLSFLGIPRMRGFPAPSGMPGNLRLLAFLGIAGMGGMPAGEGRRHAWRGAYNIWHRSSS